MRFLWSVFVIMQYTTTVSSFVFPGVHRQLRGRRERICVRGTSGPPIVVSSGLFSLMPSLTYSKFFQALQDQNLTLITTDSIRPMTRELFEDIAHTLNVNAVGFLAHSSFDKTILCSPALHAAVLCDPVVLPDNFELRQPRIELASDTNVLLLKAALSYTDEDDANEATIATASDADVVGRDVMQGVIPSFVDPVIDKGNVTRYTFQNRGHACLLDDMFAERVLQPLSQSWMMNGVNAMIGRTTPEPPAPPMFSFHTWDTKRIEPRKPAVDKQRRKKLRESRQQYRDEVAEMVARFFCELR